MSKSKVFDLADVSPHNNDQDCWVVVNARAYDVTGFLNDHPGGADVLLGAAGKDASEEFEAAGHGSAARLMLDEYYVGEVQSATPVAKTEDSERIHPAQPTLTTVESGFCDQKAVVALVSLATVAVAVGFTLYK